MSKKPEQALLIVITLIFIGLMVGILIGRQSGSGDAQIAVPESTVSIESPSENTETELPGKLNINIATEKQLSMLPGIGETYANRIVQYRESQGPFISINDLMNVKGIGQKRFDSISNYITVGG